MPKHDLPDGNETGGTLIDIREHLRRRAGLSAQDNADQEVKMSDWEIYRRAEYSDGRRPKFSRYDALCLGFVLSIGWICWLFVIK